MNWVNFMNIYEIYIIFIILVKVLFLLTILANFYWTRISKNPIAAEKTKKLLVYKEELETVFLFSMSILMFYLFFPFRKVPLVIDRESRILLFIFSIIMVIKL